MNAKSRHSKYIKFFTYLVVILLINAVGLTLFFRIDLTGNKIYSLSEASKIVVSNLSEPLTINVFFTKNLPAPHNNTERYLHDLLEEYAIHANNYFNYRFYDVSPEGESISGGSPGANRELANNYGINPVQIQVFEKDEVKFKNAYMGLVLIHGDIIEKIPTITTMSGLEYKLTSAIQKLNNKVSALLRLRDDIMVKLFLSSSLKRVAPHMGLNDLQEYPDEIEKIVKTLNNKVYNKLKYVYIDPSGDQHSPDEWEKYNLMSLKWPTLSEGKIQAGDGVIGLVMEYKDNFRVMPLLKIFRIPIIGTQYNLAEIDQIEEMINDNLETLIDINEDIGYLADHGTLNAPSFSPMGQQSNDTLSNFSTLVSGNYTLKQINLKDGSIPDSIKCLIIARPTEKFTDYELYQIDQALMQGKNLAIFLDAFNEVMPNAQQSLGFNRGPTFVPLHTGLEKLLGHYGVRIKKSLVMDQNSHKQRLPQSMGGGERPIYFVPIIKNKFINKDLEFMRNIKGLIAIKISPLELDEKRVSENKLKVHRLFASSEKSWEMTKQINLNPMFITPPTSDEEMESFALAYLMEGNFPSYFAGKPMPEKTPAKKTEKDNDKKENSEKPAEKKMSTEWAKIETKGGFVSKSKHSKVFLIASSAILRNNILDPKGEDPNAMFIINVLDTLNNKDDIAVMRSKSGTSGPGRFFRSFCFITTTLEKESNTDDV
jgi:ABC-type uncharacterized transport system involved in gliding motility auxiliary subunit